MDRAVADWFITKTTASVVAFGDEGDSEIVATFNVSSNQAESNYMAINFLEFETCNSTSYGEHLNGTVGNIADTDNEDYKNVEVGISIEKDTIVESGAWSWTNNTNAQLAFCTRVDLVTGTAFGGLTGLEGPLADIIPVSVGYVKVMYSLDIDMSNNFEVSISAEETEALTDTQTTTVTYDVSACQCILADKVCIEGEIPALSQNSLLDICVYPETSDIVIRSVLNFALQQGDLAVTFVSPDSINALTTVSDVNQKTVSISTVLISAFFLNPVAITAAGTVVLTFADTGGARQLSNIGSSTSNERQLQDEIADGTGAFALVVTLARADEVALEDEEIEASTALQISAYNGAVASFTIIIAAFNGLL